MGPVRACCARSRVCVCVAELAYLSLAHTHTHSLTHSLPRIHPRTHVCLPAHTFACLPARSSDGRHARSDGKLVREIAYLPLAESIPTAFNSCREGPRGIGWRDDKPAEVSWVECQVSWASRDLDRFGRGRGDIPSGDGETALSSPPSPHPMRWRPRSLQALAARRSHPPPRCPTHHPFPLPPHSFHTLTTIPPTPTHPPLPRTAATPVWRSPRGTSSTRCPPGMQPRAPPLSAWRAPTCAAGAWCGATTTWPL